ncbi:hypothetical protein SAURM35S_07320 [Streptomyces aurantiogriseus]
MALLGALLDLDGGGGADPALLQLGQPGAGHAPLDADEGVHEAQPLEGVAGVADLALVDLVQVLFDVGTGQGGAAENDGEIGGEAPGVELLQVLLHDHRGLDQEPGHADDVGAVLLGRLQDRGDRLLDAEVDDVVAVVGQDDVDEVLADVVDVAADGGQHDRALALRVRLLHVRFEVGDGGLHDLGGLEHERQLHLTGAEQLADDLHAVQERLVDDVECRAALEGLVEVGLQAVALAVDDAALEALLQRQGGQFLGLAGLEGLGGGALEELHELLEGVVALGAAVVDEVESGLDLFLAEAGDREDLRGVDDRGVQARLDALVEEDGVEQDAGGRVEAEGDVRQAQGGLDVGVAALELADRLDGGDAVLAGLLLTGADREGQGVDEDVLLADAPVAGQVVDQPFGDLDLLLRSAGLALLVDGQGDQRGAVLLGELRHLGEAGLGAVAVLVVDGVDHRAAAELLQAGADDVDLGGVQHDRQSGGGGEAAGQFLHVGDAVAADVVHAQVEHVRALADLFAGHLHTVVPAALQHGLTELLGTVGVGALTDGQVRGVLAERDRLVERGGAGLGLGVALDGSGPLDPFHELPQVLGRRAAAAADQVQPVVAYEGLLGVGQAFGVQREVGAVLGEDRQAGVGHAQQRGAGVPGQVAQVFAHLGRARRAVQADHVDTEGLQRGQRGADLRAEQHGAGRLERHRDQQRHVDAGRLHRAPRAQDRRLRLEQVLRGLDDQGVRAAGEQALGVRLEAVAQRAVADVAEGGQLRAGSDRTQHPALAAVARAVLVGRLTGDAGARLGQLVHAVGDVVLGHGRVVRAEGVRLDAVHAGAEVRLVDGADDVRPGDVEDLVAALEVLEVLEGGLLGLEHGAHGPVGHHHTGGEGLTERGHTGPAVGGRGRRHRGHERAPSDATAVGFAAPAVAPRAAPAGRHTELPVEGARRQGSRVRGLMVRASTGRTRMAAASPPRNE